MKETTSKVTIEGETTPCGSCTNEGDGLLKEVFERETGQSYDAPSKPNASASGRTLSQCLRK